MGKTWAQALSPSPSVGKMLLAGKMVVLCLKVLRAACVADLRTEVLLQGLCIILPQLTAIWCVQAASFHHGCGGVSKKGNQCTAEFANTESHNMGDGIALCIWENAFVGWMHQKQHSRSCALFVLWKCKPIHFMRSAVLPLRVNLKGAFRLSAF